ncbi:MAG: hypothetical protein ACKOUS_18470, partial [Alphaproteobacteria bacterium]
QLSDLARTLREVMEAGNAARIAPDTWFSRIRAAAAASSRDPRRMAEFQRLGGAFGEYLDDLPYQSAIMEITQEDWVAMGAGRRREILNDIEAKQVAIYTLHLRTPVGRNNHARAEKQYRELSQFGGTEPLYYPIAEGDLGRFGATVDRLADALLANVAATLGRPIAGIAPPTTPEERRLAEQAEVVGNAMRLSYLGRVRREAVPEVVRSVVLSEDAVDPTPERRPVEPRVLLTRNQLSDLARTLREVMEAGNAARIAPDTWFSRIRAAAAASSRDPRRMAEFQRLGGAFGEYLDDLPYQSTIMEITQEDWVAMGAGRRREILNDIEAKLRLYEEYNRQQALWVNLDGGRDPGEAMYPVPLDALP